MDDLAKLNRRIALHWLGILDADQEAYVAHASVCLGQFPHSAAKLAEFLAHSKLPHHNSLPVAKLNRQYLRFARLAAKDISSGKHKMILTLGITLAQASALGNLTNEAMNRLAYGWDGPIIRFARRAFERGIALRVYGAKHHATALLASEFFPEIEERP